MVGSDRFRFLVFLKRVSISSLVCFVGFVVVVEDVEKVRFPSNLDYFPLIFVFNLIPRLPRLYHRWP